MSSEPFVSVAVFCSEVVREEDGPTTLRRVYDRITILDEGDPSLLVKAFIWIHAGSIRGAYLLHVVVRDSEGEPISQEAVQELEFSSNEESESAMVQIDFLLRPTDEGLHWLEVSVDQELKTKAPMVIRWTPDSRRATDPE